MCTKFQVSIVFVLSGDDTHTTKKIDRPVDIRAIIRNQLTHGDLTNGELQNFISRRILRIALFCIHLGENLKIPVLVSFTNFNVAFG